MAVNRQDVTEKLVGYFKRKTTSAVEEETDLFAAGILDSMEVMELIQFLETEFKVEIEPEEVAEENFRSVRAIRALIEGKLP